MAFNFKAALASIDSNNKSLATALVDIIDNPAFDATLSKEQVASLLAVSGLTMGDLTLALLPLATSLSISSISNFSVGAIATGLSGRLYFGANMEFENVPLSHSVHAEQSAISHAWLKGELGILNISVNYSPCGHCRQFMNELSSANELSIQLPNHELQMLQHYLPDSFGPQDLATSRRLMDQQAQTFAFNDSASEGQLAQAALAAMNLSYAPYSQYYCGIALELSSGAVFQGRYAENAAFNPSLSPLQVALVQIVMAGQTVKDVVRAILVENTNSQISYAKEIEGLLYSLNENIEFACISV